MGIFNKNNNKYIKTEMNGAPKSKITSFFDHLKLYTQQYLAISSVIGIIWGGFLVYDNFRDTNKVMQQDVKSIISVQKQQQRTDSLLLQNQIEMSRELGIIKETGNENIEKLNSLQKSYIRYISNDKALSKQDFLEYMEGLTIEEKKSSSVNEKK